MREVSPPGSSARPRRLWVLSELYHPEETSTGYLLTRIAEGLAKDVDVRVLCSQPTYASRGLRAPGTEVRNRVRIRRCPSTTLDRTVRFHRLLNVLTITASQERSQMRNREAARERLVEIIAEAVAPPTPRRRPTRPSRGAIERRLVDKRKRAETKRHRRATDD